MTDVLRFPDGPDGVKAAAFTRECVYRYVLRAIEKYRLDGDPETRKPPGNAIQS